MPENLYEFFRAACRPAAHHICSQFWIDGLFWIYQICIDQTNFRKRCHQVSQMGDVYATTKHTILWPWLMPPLATTNHNSLHERTTPEWRIFSFRLGLFAINFLKISKNMTVPYIGPKVPDSFRVSVTTCSR